jgi:hypothetical protein
MKKTILLGSAIARKAQAFIKGGDEMLEPADGGSCCATIPSSVTYGSGGAILSVIYQRDCGFSRANAIAAADSAAAQTGARTWWCCASC